jgi:elongation factor Ts
MEITLDLIKELRNKTGVGISDCKKALTEAGGDIDKAIEILRKKGAAMATKRADKAANEGAVKASISDDKKNGAIIEVNCETDFVAKGDDFQKFAGDIADAVLANENGDLEKVLNSQMSDGLTVKDNIDSMMGKVGEKVELKRAKFIKIDDGFVSGYVHFGSKLGALVGLKGEATEDADRLGKNLAMQVVAMNPQAIDRDGIPKETIETERDIFLTAAKNDNKPEDIAKKITENKIERFYQDHVLLEQEYINEAGKSIKNLIDEFNKNTGNNLEIKEIVRYHLGGEG